MSRLAAWGLAFGFLGGATAAGCELGAESGDRLVVVVGAEGNAEYGEQFDAWAEEWRTHAAAIDVELVMIGDDDRSDRSDRVELQAILQQAATELPPEARLWLVLIGHGSSDGVQAKFNLRGPDIAALELAGWLDPVRASTVVAVCCSASGPFVSRLSRRGRVVVSATRSGHEYNYSRFGGFFARAVRDPEADLDHDQQVSVLEAFLFASAAVEDWYRGQSRLATEHALIDDDGDGFGTPASWFRGVRAVRSARSGAVPDGLRASQLALDPSALERAIPVELRTRRDELELQLEALRLEKKVMEPEAYDAALEALLVPLARIYEGLADS